MAICNRQITVHYFYAVLGLAAKPQAVVFYASIANGKETCAGFLTAALASLEADSSELNWS